MTREREGEGKKESERNESEREEGNESRGGRVREPVRNI